MLKWLKKLFSREPAMEEEWSWEDDGARELDRRSMRLSEASQMEEYVRGCCQQMREATAEIDKASMEYRLVTERLRDMEEIEGLPEADRARIYSCAKKIMDLTQDRQVHQSKLGGLPEEQYRLMERNEDDVPDAIRTLKDREEYKTLVRTDLQNLEGEKVSYRFRKRELSETQIMCRDMCFVTLFAAVLLVGVLLFFQIYLELNVQIGYVLVVALCATALTVLFLQFNNAKSEMKTVDRKLSKAISLQNTVKIRYVNATNLIEYYCERYGVHTSDELRYLWERYLVEQKERKMLREADALIEDKQNELLDLLKEQRIISPHIWLDQVPALVEPREMVEIRHGLYSRRQSLRKRIEYNESSRETASREVKSLAKEYPVHSGLIMSIVDEFDRD